LSQSLNGGALRIETVKDKATRAAWLKTPYRVFKDDPNWIAPLRVMEEPRFQPKHPFFEFGAASLFVAFRVDEPVGRISAHINRRHLDRYNDKTGHFGFFDCLEDEEAAKALVDAAAAWLAERGMTRMVGPLNFSTNEETGLLVEGFDTPPAFMMTHARTWSGLLLEKAGLVKEMDVYAYRMDPNKLPDRAARLAAKAQESGRITVRPLNMRRLKNEVDVVIDIYNDAWSENWGFVPFAKVEVDALASDLKLILRSNYGRFVEVDGRPAAFMIGLPDLNGATAGFNGRLLPFNWLSLIVKLAREDFRGARIPLMGIRRKYHNSPISMGILAIFAREFAAEARTKKLEWVEFSWVLECNKPMNALGRMAAGPPVKTFRIYAKPLKIKG
jgi:hypothetical protein